MEPDPGIFAECLDTRETDDVRKETSRCGDIRNHQQFHLDGDEYILTNVHYTTSLSVLLRLDLRRLDFSGSKNSAKPNEMICAEKQRTVYKLSLLTTLNYVRDSDKVSCRSYCVLKIKNICELGEGNIFQLNLGY